MLQKLDSRLVVCTSQNLESFSKARSFAEFTLERSEGLRMTNECNSLLTMGLRDAIKISHTQIQQFPSAPRVSSCAPTSRGQSKEFRTLEGDYKGQSSDFNMKKGSQKKVFFGHFFC